MLKMKRDENEQTKVQDKKKLLRRYCKELYHTCKFKLVFLSLSFSSFITVCRRVYLLFLSFRRGDGDSLEPCLIAGFAYNDHDFYISKQEGTSFSPFCCWVWAGGQYSLYFPHDFPYSWKVDRNKGHSVYSWVMILEQIRFFILSMKGEFTNSDSCC